MKKVSWVVVIAGAVVGLAGNADAMNEAKEIVVGGLSNNGKAAVCLGILIMLGVSLWNMPKAVSAPVEAAK